jgi:hypothetical protein
MPLMKSTFDKAAEEVVRIVRMYVFYLWCNRPSAISLTSVPWSMVS